MGSEVIFEDRTTGAIIAVRARSGKRSDLQPSWRSRFLV